MTPALAIALVILGILIAFEVSLYRSNRRARLDFQNRKRLP